MTTFTISNPKILDFMERNNLDLEMILVDLLPILDYCLGKKEQGIDFMKDSLSNLLSQIKAENEITHERQQSIVQNTIQQQAIQLSSLTTQLENVLLKNNNEIIQLLSKSEDASTDKIMKQVQQILEQNQAHISNMITHGNDKSFMEEIVKSGTKQVEHFLEQNKKDLTNLIANANNKTEMEHILKSNNQEIMGMYTNSIQNLLLPIQTSLNDISTSFRSSTKKGIYSENKIEVVLNHCFPNTEIQNTRNIPQSGDYIMNHQTCGKVMFENKDYTNNVPKQEIDKFIRDTTIHKTHGILMSQVSGISQKPHYHIEFNEHKKILMYLHHVNYDEQTIKECISVLTSLVMITKDVHANESAMTEEDIVQIFEEWKTLQQTNQQVIDCLNEQIKRLRGIDIPRLKDILSSRFPHNVSTYTCEFCNGLFKNKGALSSHHRWCKEKKKVESNESCIEIK